MVTSPNSRVDAGLIQTMQKLLSHVKQVTLFVLLAFNVPSKKISHFVTSNQGRLSTLRIVNEKQCIHSSYTLRPTHNEFTNLRGM